MLEKIYLHIGPHVGQQQHWLFDPLYYFMNCQTNEQNAIIQCSYEPYTYLLMPINFIAPIGFVIAYFVSRKIFNKLKKLHIR